MPAMLAVVILVSEGFLKTFRDFRESIRSLKGQEETNLLVTFAS